MDDSVKNIFQELGWDIDTCGNKIFSFFVYFSNTEFILIRKGFWKNLNDGSIDVDWDKFVKDVN